MTPPASSASASASTTSRPADVLLADGSVAVVRQLDATDADALSGLHARVDEDALRLRFFAASRRSAEAYVEHVLASPDVLALVAERRGEIVALATAEPIDATDREVAFLVDGSVRGLGVGTLLLEHLAALARDRGTVRFVAEVLPENRRMLGVFADAGFTSARHLEDGVVTVELSTVVTPALLDAADDRQCVAEGRSLAPLFRPRSVAVVGVRGDGSGVGAAIVRSIVAGGYTGRLTVVHPSGATSFETSTVTSLSEVPDGVDLVVVAVPPSACVAVVEQAAAAGAGACVVVTSGFAEDGPDGLVLQQELARSARRLGVRLVGPNCLGVVGNDPDIRLDATFGTGIPLPGGLAVASQSGGVGIAVVERAREQGLGLSCFVSLGNKADVSGNDLLAAWYDDPQVSAAGLYLESFGNARSFARLARRFSRRKPLLAVVGGRSTGGRRAGSSHTAAAASAAVGVDALFAQAGVIACRDTDDLVDTARLLAEQPLPAGRRVAVVSNAGGMGVIAADLAADLGLEVPELSPDLRARLAAAGPAVAGTGNPVDAGAGAGPDQVGTIVEAVLASGEVDAVLVPLVATGLAGGPETGAAVAAAAAAHPHVPLVVVAMGGLDLGAPEALTAFSSMQTALAALARAAAYAAWRDAPVATEDHDRPAPRPPVETARAAAASLLARAGSDDSWVAAADAGSLMAPYGLAVTGERVRSQRAAVETAARLGYPVVVKSDSADVVHKTERGLVRTGLRTAGQVRDAVRAIRRELGDDAEMLVQHQASGVEVAIGVVRDPSLGPLVMIAAGGVATEVWADRVFLLPPAATADVERALRGLRLWPLLAGYRGSAAVDVAALADLVVAVARLALDVPEVAELDLNPVLVDPDGCAVVDLALRLATPAEADLARLSELRQLRSSR